MSINCIETRLSVLIILEKVKWKSEKKMKLQWAVSKFVHCVKPAVSCVWTCTAAVNLVWVRRSHLRCFAPAEVGNSPQICPQDLTHLAFHKVLIFFISVFIGDKFNFIVSFYCKYFDVDSFYLFSDLNIWLCFFMFINTVWWECCL